MSWKNECHEKMNVMKEGTSWKKECHEKGMSWKKECHEKRNVRKKGMSGKSNIRKKHWTIGQELYCGMCIKTVGDL